MIAGIVTNQPPACVLHILSQILSDISVLRAHLTATVVHFNFGDSNYSVHKFYILVHCVHRGCSSRVVSRIFVPKRDEVEGELIRLHDDELYDMYSSPNII